MKPDPDSVPLSRAMPRLLVLALAVGLGFALSGSFSTVQEAAKADLGLTDVQLGLVQGVGVAVPLVLLSVPIGLLVDRWKRVRLMLAFWALGVVGTLATAFAVNISMLFVARMMTGIAMTGSLTAALSVAADLCVPEKRGRAVMVINVGKALGVAAGFAVAGSLYGLFVNGTRWLDSLQPWRATHLAIAAGALVVVIPLLLCREPLRREGELLVTSSLRQRLQEFWKHRHLLAPLFAGQVSVTTADAAATIWASPVLSRSYGLSPQQFAGWMGALLVAAGLSGVVVGGSVADLGQRSKGRGGLFIGAVAAAAVGVPSALFPVSSSPVLFALALGSLIFAGTIVATITSVALTVFLPNELRGLAIGTLIALAGLVGYGCAPPLVGWISQLLGGEDHLASALALVGVATSSLSLGALIIAMRSSPVVSSVRA